MLALAERGAQVVGLDFASALLTQARDLARDLGARVRVLRGDMRRLPFRSECAGAAILMDAFGFFDTEEEHELVLQEAARVVATGGRFVLKLVNGGIILDAFREEEREERDGAVIAVSNTLVLDPPRMTQRIRISGARGDGEYERRQRLYRVEEVRAALERAGFSVVGVFASPDGEPFEPAVSPAMWIVGER